MPASLDELDLLLLTATSSRKVRQDGIHFMGFRYIALTLAAYVGEEVTLRYDPRDVAEVRVFFREKFLCRAICQELAGETVPVREIVRVRRTRHRELRAIIEDRRRAAAAFEEPKPATRREQLLVRRPSAPASKPTTWWLRRRTMSM